MLSQSGLAESAYSKMEGHRHSYLERARDAARLTIPHLFPDEGHTSSTKFPTPYQSVGARGVNNLASALLLSLLPPNAPFFRLVLDQAALNEIEAQLNADQLKTQFDASLAKIEKSVVQEIETKNHRVQIFEALKHLIVAGNVLLNVTEDGELRVIHLDRFVVQRCPMGKPRKVIVKEMVVPSMLPEAAREIVLSQKPTGYEDGVALYTCIESLPNNQQRIFQEICGVIVPESDGIVKEDMSPYMVLRMNRADGEDYGRGYVEQYIGDLKSLESLMMSVVEASAAAAKVLFLVAPNGTTRARVLSEAPNGGIVEGSAGDVSVLQLNKAADLQVAQTSIQVISDRLSYAFLLTDNAIRNAERVTAAEVRLVTQSIERQLGGIYSVLSQEFQLPMVRRLMDLMSRQNRLPALPNDLVHPLIVTGVEALGRGNDLNKMDEFLAGIGQLLGPEVLGRFVNISEYMTRRAAALGLDSEGLIKSEEEMMAEQQQQQQQMMLQQMGPALAQQFQQQQENVAPTEEPA